jgi:hypothetical protein
MTVKNAAMLVELAVKSGVRAETATEHFRRMKRHREEWPALWQAIDQLVGALRQERNYVPGEKEALREFVKVR